MTTTFEKFKATELYAAMVECGNYFSDDEIKDAFDEMRYRVIAGDDPGDVLHDEGFEPDYFMDIV